MHGTYGAGRAHRALRVSECIKAKKWLLSIPVSRDSITLCGIEHGKRFRRKNE